MRRGGILPVTPPPPNFQIPPVAKSDGVSPQAPGRLFGQSRGGPSGIGSSLSEREASGGSLFPTEAGRLDTEMIRRGGKGRGDHKHAGTGGGRVGEFMLEGTQEKRRYGDLTGGRRGGGRDWVTWGRVIWRIINTGL